MVKPVSFKGFQKGFQGVSLRGFRGVQIFLWELCVCIKYLSLGDFACGTGGFITSWLKALKPQIKDTANQQQYNDSIYGIEKKQFPYMLCVTNMLLHDIDLPQIYHDNSLLRDVLDYTEDDQFEILSCKLIQCFTNDNRETPCNQALWKVA